MLGIVEFFIVNVHACHRVSAWAYFESV